MTVPVETFTEEERERLAPHFTNLDRPVFGLVNLPETVKGAMFARYSRYPGTLRRMFLDEFADSLPEVSGIEGAEGQRAAASLAKAIDIAELFQVSTDRLMGAEFASLLERELADRERFARVEARIKRGATPLQSV